jgi:hypothetical protein
MKLAGGWKADYAQYTRIRAQFEVKDPYPPPLPCQNATGKIALFVKKLPPGKLAMVGQEPLPPLPPLPQLLPDPDEDQGEYISQCASTSCHDEGSNFIRELTEGLGESVRGRETMNSGKTVQSQAFQNSTDPRLRQSRENINPSDLVLF